MTRIFILSLLAGFIGMIIANSKGRNPYGWFIVCFLLPLSAVVLLFLPPRVTLENVRQCPDCGEMMRNNSRMCPSCHRESPITMVTCPSCGIIVKEGSRCDNCGKSLT